MLPLLMDRELERVAARLGDTGAMALVLVEAQALGRIERRFGGEAYQLAMEGLMSLVREVTQDSIPDGDVLVTEDPSRDAILAFVFRRRSDRRFYASRLADLCSRIGSEIARQGKRAVYPYHREPLSVGVGQAVVLHNPTIKPSRLIAQAVVEARRDAQLEVQIQERRSRRQLLQLILKGQLNVRYEPIVELDNPRVLGYEALTRGPEGTDLQTPAQLFRRAEASGLLFELDCLCRRVALEGVDTLPAGSKLFLNCLPTSIWDPNLRDEGLRKTLETFHLQPSDLVLEISESESIENFGIFQEVRDSCRELGIGIAIDDAGTGYASLEAIMEINADYVKTDRGLVRGIDSDPPRQEVVRALLTVARGIGAQVIAEGIETDSELRVLRELGIRYGQGFYFGAALSGELAPPRSSLRPAP